MNVTATFSGRFETLGDADESPRRLPRAPFTIALTGRPSRHGSPGAFFTSLLHAP